MSYLQESILTLSKGLFFVLCVCVLSCTDEDPKDKDSSSLKKDKNAHNDTPTNNETPTDKDTTTTNQAPIFSFEGNATSYTFSQSEHSNRFDSIGKVSARDPEQDTISYSLSTASHTFAIDVRTGVISNKLFLDYETLSQAHREQGFLLTVRASDEQHTTTARVNIMITDVDDSPRLSILSIQPDYGFVGTSVSIRGQAFSSTAAENTVTFLGSENNGTDDQRARIVRSNGSTIDIEVPTGARTGQIQVDVQGISTPALSSAHFTVIDPSPIDLPTGSTSFPFDADRDQLIDIHYLEQLYVIRYDLDGNGVVDTGLGAASVQAYARVFPTHTTGTYTGYELIKDLDFKNGETNTDNFSIWAEGSTATNAQLRGWDPIGPTLVPAYDAIFEGNGHTISNLYTNFSSEGYRSGLFTHLDARGMIRGVGLAQVKATLSGNMSFGALVHTNSGKIAACYTTGSISGGRLIGGLAYFNSGTIKACYSTVRVAASQAQLGGAAGLVYHNTGEIVACYATGDLSSEALVEYSGGLVAINRDSGTIKYCYARAHVMNGASLGESGGLVWDNQGQIVESYFDTNLSSAKGIGEKSTIDLQTPTNYTGIYANWNVDVDGNMGADNPWHFGSSSQYPKLQVDFDGDGDIDANDEFGP